MENAKRMLRKVFLAGTVLTAMFIGCKQPAKEKLDGVKTFEVTVTKPANGIISVKKGSTVLTADALKAVEENTELSITLTADDGHKAVKLVVNGEETKSADGDKTITKTVKVTQALKVSGETAVQSTPAKTFEVTVTKPTNGTISVKKGNAVLTGEALKAVEENTELTITLTANNGYKAVKLVVNGEETKSADGDKTITKTVKVTKALKVSGETAVQNTPAKTFEVTVTKPANGIITVKKGSAVLTGEALKAVEENAELAITLTANDGYKAVKLVIDGKETKSADGGKSITAAVKVTKALKVSGETAPTSTEQKKCKVNFSVENKEGGELILSCNGQIFATGSTFNEGESLIFSARPADGYEVAEWKGITVTPKNKKVVKVNITENMNVTVRFAKRALPKFTITFGVDGEGGTLEAALDGKTYTNGSLEVESGKTVTFTAKHNANYKVDSWTGVKAAAGAKTASLTVTEAKTVKVKFTKVKYNVTFSVDGDGGTLEADIDGKKESTSVSKTIQVEHGKTVNFTAKPDANYKIDSWTGVSAAAGVQTASLTVTEAKTVKVKFVPTSGTTPTPPTVEKFPVTFEVEGSIGGSLQATIEGGTTETTNASATIRVEKNKTVTFTATPDAGYEVERWTGVASGGEFTASLTVTKAETVKVKFTKIKYNVTFSVAGAGGTLKAEVDGNTQVANTNAATIQVEHGKTVNFTAEPNGNFAVESWTGLTAYPTNATTASIIVTREVNVQVKFVATVQQFRVNYAIKDGKGGYLTAFIASPYKLVKNGDMVDAGVTVSFSCSPEDGWKIKEWKGLTATPPKATSVQVVVNTDLNVEVVLEEENPAPPPENNKVSIKVVVNGETEGGMVEAAQTGLAYTEIPVGTTHDFQIPKGSNFMFKITVNSGFDFTCSEQLENGKKHKLIRNIQNGMTITVTFVKKTNPPSQGDNDPPSQGDNNEGKVSITITAIGPGGELMLGLNGKGNTNIIASPTGAKKTFEIDKGGTFSINTMFLAMDGYKVTKWEGCDPPESGKSYVTIKNIQNNMSITVTVDRI